MADAYQPSPQLGEVLSELRQGTDHEISLAADAHQGIVDVARANLRSAIAESGGAADVMRAQMFGIIHSQIDESSAVSQALSNQARRGVTAEVLAAQGTAQLQGLPLIGGGAGNVPPQAITPGQGLLPGGYLQPKPYPWWGPPAPGSSFTIINEPVPPSGPGQPPQQIQTTPPPIGIGQCPPTSPCPPCPLPPENPCQFRIWASFCDAGGGSTCYILPAGQLPLDARDIRLEPPLADPQGRPICDAWTYCNDHNVPALCAPGKPPKPGQTIINEPLPIPPGQCQQPPCGGVIINTPPGGTIINQPAQPIRTTPPITGIPPSSGAIINIINAPPQTPQGLIANQPAEAQPGLQGGRIVNIEKCCLASLPAGSAAWCKCADGLKPAFESLGQTIIDAWSEGEFDKPAIRGSLWNYASELVGRINECEYADVDNMMSWEVDAANRILAHIEGAWCDMGPAMMGIAYLRAQLDVVESFTASLDGGNTGNCGAVLTMGAKGLGFSDGIGTSRSQRIGFSLSFKLPEVRAVIDQLALYWNPTETIGRAESLQMFLHGNLDAAGFACAVQASGINPLWAPIVADSAREQLASFEYGQAFLRKYISEEDYQKSLRNRGLLHKSDRDLAQRLTEFLPPPTDVLHFIVRGIGDPGIVKRFGLLEEFDTLYQGDLVKWGEAAGIKKSTMEAYHAAHWIVPGPGQLFTMLQRLRPDNIPPGVNQADWQVTAEDVNRALRENAFAPFWRPRLEAIAYNPIPRRDILQIFQHGLLTADQLPGKFQDLGYSAENAKIIAKTYLARAFDALRKEEYIVLYGQSAVTREQAIEQLRTLGYADEIIGKALDYEDNIADAKTRIDCLKSFERDYALGGLSDAEANQALLTAGIDIRQAMRLLVQWACRRKARSKAIPAATLCKWLARGTIDGNEYVSRLVRVGYSPADAAAMLAECLAELSDKRLAARLKEAKQQQAAAIRQQKAGAYISKQEALANAAEIKAIAKAIAVKAKAEAAIIKQQRLTTSQEERDAAKAAAAAGKALKAEERREARLQAAAEKLAITSGSTASDAANAILAALVGLMAIPGMDQDTADEAVKLAASDKRATALSIFADLANQAGQAAVAIETLATSVSSPTGLGTARQATPAPPPGGTRPTSPAGHEQPLPAATASQLPPTPPVIQK